MKLWLNGRLREAADPAIPASDRGLLLGDGLFETLALREGRPRRLAAHLARLRQGAALLELPPPGVDLGAAMEALAAANSIAEGSLRLTLTRGSGPRGIAPPETPDPTLLITVAPAVAPAAVRQAVIARGTRRNEHSPLAQVKSLNALDAVLARLEARRRGADEAILLNTAGRVAEASAANLFALLEGRLLLTPPLAEGVLPGVMRAAILERGAAEEAPLTVKDLQRAEAILLTSALGLRGIRRLEERELPGRGLAARLAADLACPWAE